MEIRSDFFLKTYFYRVKFKETSYTLAYGTPKIQLRQQNR
jgi:hypothetical protein